MVICGGWSKFRAVTEDDLAVFQEAMDGFTGSCFEPLIVSTQVVAGTNYRFICNAKMVTNPPKQYTADVRIYKPLKEKAVITHIEEI